MTKEKTRNIFLSGLFWVALKLIPYLVYLSALGILFLLFSNAKFDTSNLTNGIFAILAALAAICFSWVRALPTDDIKVPEILQHGERLLLAAILFLFGSVYKFAFYKFYFSNHTDFRTSIYVPYMLICMSFFLAGFRIAIKTILKILGYLMNKYPDSRDPDIW